MGKRRITVDIARQIRVLYNEGLSYTQVAGRVGFSAGTVQGVVRGCAWVAEIANATGVRCAPRAAAGARPPLEQFLDKAIPVPEAGCWLWLGAVDQWGYGRFGMGRETLAHRCAWILLRGPIPDGKCVCHKCDTPPCVNPDHLFLGSNQENMDDMAAKGRRWSVLKPDAARAIRSRRLAGEDGVALAAEFGVSPSLVYGIAKGQFWRRL